MDGEVIEGGQLNGSCGSSSDLEGCGGCLSECNGLCQKECMEGGGGNLDRGLNGVTQVVDLKWRRTFSFDSMLAPMKSAFHYAIHPVALFSNIFSKNRGRRENLEYEKEGGVHEDSRKKEGRWSGMGDDFEISTFCATNNDDYRESKENAGMMDGGCDRLRKRIICPVEAKIESSGNIDENLTQSEPLASSCNDDTEESEEILVLNVEKPTRFASVVEQKQTEDNLVQMGITSRIHTVIKDADHDEILDFRPCKLTRKNNATEYIASKKRIERHRNAIDVEEIHVAKMYSKVENSPPDRNFLNPNYSKLLQLLDTAADEE